jgi:endonuclease G
MPNEKSNKPLKDYAVTIDSVQKLTGIIFYPNIQDVKLEEMVKKTICKECWIWE